MKQCPAASAPNTPRPRSDIGRCVDEHACPGPRSLPRGLLAFGAAVRLRLPSHTPSRERRCLSIGQAPSHAVAFASRLPPIGPAGDLHPQSLHHAQRTRPAVRRAVQRIRVNRESHSRIRSKVLGQEFEARARRRVSASLARMIGRREVSGPRRVGRQTRVPRRQPRHRHSVRVERDRGVGSPEVINVLRVPLGNPRVRQSHVQFLKQRDFLRQGQSFRRRDLLSNFIDRILGFCRQNAAIFCVLVTSLGGSKFKLGFAATGSKPVLTGSAACPVDRCVLPLGFK